MDTLDIKSIFIEAFCRLDEQFLLKLDGAAFYSTNTRSEIILELEKVFNEIRETGITAMKPVKSMCKFCYPNGDVFSFHNPSNNEFIVRYVFQDLRKDGDGLRHFIFQECKNSPIQDSNNGMPF